LPDDSHELTCTATTAMLAAMPDRARPAPNLTRPLVVGSVASAADLAALDPAAAAAACDVVEIRLDRLAADTTPPERALWRHLAGLPLLFTARCAAEGGAGNANATTRAKWLYAALPDAAWIDLEAASLDGLAPVAAAARRQGVALVVSHHDFTQLPPDDALEETLERARQAGAAVVKVAAQLADVDDLARLARFTLAVRGIAPATMGMGPLAAVSRLLCAQCGSTLNYGFLGHHPTAQGQWPARRLRETLRELPAVIC